MAMRIEGIGSVSQAKPVETPAFFPGTEARETTATAKEGRSRRTSSKSKEHEMIASIESANQDLKTVDKRLEFSIQEKTKQIMVKVIDQHTDEVIREIPSQKILDVIAGILECAGIIVDEKA